jgi:hypothetical protein
MLREVQAVAASAKNTLPRPAARWLLSPLGLAVWLAAGCGNSGAPLGEVEGTVSLGGRPLANVVVEFIPDAEQGTTGPRSSAVTDAQGFFVLQCEDQRPGAVVGHHRVVVRATGRSAAQVQRDPRRDREHEPASNPDAPKDGPRLPREYRSAASTPLRKEVEPGKQRIELTLNSPPKKRS